ncbi:MAG: hydrogenase maturation protein HypF [Nocardioidaceae bacterium]|nr:hydrogenase maturation protein HypF [Nocardioidaceae bacterium]
MCLGIPGQVIKLLDGYHGQLALVDVAGAERKVNIGMLEDENLDAGDWVVIHMGFAVERVDEAGAREAMAGLELVGQARETRVRKRFEITGLVQGVGFRPFVYVLASDLALSGSVINNSAGVIAEVEGPTAAVDAFSARLRTDAPPLSVVESIQVSDVAPTGGTGFLIEHSQRAEGRRTLASPDVATCDDCLRELTDPHDRRYRHPFITCTNCGPRFTIITELPYDRPATTMADFAMCDRCRAEYEDPTDRRFHAQPIACPECGPHLEYVDSEGRISGDGESLAFARYKLSIGAILAVKGIGGYHLVCDAENEDAVAELRRRKQRGNKPFAIMVADLAAARDIVWMDAAEERLLTDPRRPIALLRRRADAAISVAESVAPDTDELGVLLPYSGSHVLLMGLAGDSSGPRALVMTSGNRGGEPIVTDDDDALVRLSPLVDGWLTHARRIHVPCDDSVARVVEGAELPIRRSRGYAPMPIALPFDVPPTLAVGADLKNTCAVAEGRHLWFSQHIGDMDDVATVDAFDATERHLEELTGVSPAVLVCDDHPGYRSTRWAVTHRDGRDLTSVQHHHAHVASVMGEHGLDGTAPVIGFAFDGTGYGPDHAIWGGEVLIADYSGFRRFAHLSNVSLAGGDASVERPYRMALSHLRSAGIDWSPQLPPVAACPADELSVLRHQLGTGFGCVPTSSMGRLFDAVASLTGMRHTASYEAEAAMVLESVAAPDTGAADYRFMLSPSEQGPLLLDPAPLLSAIVRDLRGGVPVDRIAGQFHSAVVDAMVVVALRARASDDDTGLLNTVVLGGGVFQNARLLGEAVRRLRAEEFEVLVPVRLPPNDGGLALGQTLIAGAR